jgi:hypothetical protein
MIADFSEIDGWRLIRRVLCQAFGQSAKYEKSDASSAVAVPNGMQLA